MKTTTNNINARIWGKRYNPTTKTLGKNTEDTISERYYIYNGIIYFGCRWGIFFYSAFNEQHDPIDML